MRQIALVAYESRFARCGGVTAVLNYLPGSLAKATGAPTCVFTPFHFRIRETINLAPKVLGVVQVPFAAFNVPVRVLRHEDRGTWIFLDAQDFVIPQEHRTEEGDTHFFGGCRHPYDVGHGAGDQLAILRRDALFFGAAAARALELIDRDGPWTVLMQDWQAATTALALAGRSLPVHCHLTLHNSYDSGGVWPMELKRVGIDSATVPGADGSEAATVLNRVFPVVRSPIFTVSRQFALDFTEDVFQREIMASQLQHALSPPNIVGINNGPFASQSIPPEALTAAREHHDFGPLHAWKRDRKRQAVEALRAFQPSPERPAWGDLAKFVSAASATDTPWFILGGRDDSRQKGYDVAAAAVKNLLDDAGKMYKGQFLFFPMPGDEGREGLAFLKDLAEAYPAQVLVLPFIFVEGYLAALQGAAFGVMPSLYEPFGMANEFYLNGAMGIGRATGGLVEQIVPLRSAPSFTAAAARRADRWHALDASATGILYREPDDLPSVAEDWRGLNGVGYVVGGHPNRVEERSRYRLFNEMVKGLERALGDGLELYGRTQGHEDYYLSLVKGVAFVQRTLSWDASAREYCRYLG